MNEDRYALAPDLGFYLVADGIGGHSAGQVASQLAAEAALRTIESLRGDPSRTTEKLRRALLAANREVYAAARAKPELAGMGTTLVGLLVEESCAALAHVGDSRAYRVRCGQIDRLTEDHTLVSELLLRREISAAGLREHPQRHVLTRAVGVGRCVTPELKEVSVIAGDALVLCSDGLTEHVADGEISAVLAHSNDPQQACDSLVELANRRGGRDNTTVVLVQWD